MRRAFLWICNPAIQPPVSAGVLALAHRQKVATGHLRHGDGHGHVPPLALAPAVLNEHGVRDAAHDGAEGDDLPW